MKKYDITPDNIQDFMDNWESQFPLEINDKAGLDYQDSEIKAVQASACIYCIKSKARCVQLEITSFRGVSFDAIHYYGKLMADGIEFQSISNPNITTSNWEAKKKNPFYQWRYDFRLCRPITKQEIDSNPDRWEGYGPGDFTDCFNTKEELIELAKRCFKMRFVGEWELWMVDKTVAKMDYGKLKYEKED